MRFISSLLFLWFITPQFTSAQEPPKVVHATSEKVSIRDGAYFEKDSWYLSPQTTLDIYTAYRDRQAKWVTFYTDIDSISFHLRPGVNHDFIILLNGTDTCHTRLQSSLSTLVGAETKNDTIPFTLTKENAIAVKALINGQDTAMMHFDLGTYDFRLIKAYHQKINSAKIKSIRLGSLHRTNPAVTIAQNAAHHMDGRFGWHVFDQRVIHLDYERSLLIISDTLPFEAQNYQAQPLVFIKSWPCIEAQVQAGAQNYAGYFLLDNGSEFNVVLDKSWVEYQQFPLDLPVLKSNTITDGLGQKFETKTVLVDKININQNNLFNVPALLLQRDGLIGAQVNYLGNQILKQFNLIIDLKNDVIYIKPNLNYKISQKR